MDNKPLSVETALDQFVERFLSLYQTDMPPMPQQQFDAEWPSDCYQKEYIDGDQCGWKPTPQGHPQDLFEGLANALEVDIHPDIKAYYTHLWSDPLPAACPDGDLELIFVWNDDDYERLRANLIGHALMKKKRRQPLTLFFACTEPEEMVISIDNASGEIVVETPGKKPHQILSSSMADFISQLSPRKIT